MANLTTDESPSPSVNASFSNLTMAPTDASFTSFLLKYSGQGDERRASRAGRVHPTDSPAMTPAIPLQQLADAAPSGGSPPNMSFQFGTPPPGTLTLGGEPFVMAGMGGSFGMGSFGAVPSQWNAAKERVQSGEDASPPKEKSEARSKPGKGQVRVAFPETTEASSEISDIKASDEHFQPGLLGAGQVGGPKFTNSTSSAAARSNSGVPLARLVLLLYRVAQTTKANKDVCRYLMFKSLNPPFV